MKKLLESDLQPKGDIQIYKIWIPRETPDLKYRIEYLVCVADQISRSEKRYIDFYAKTGKVKLVKKMPRKILEQRIRARQIALNNLNQEIALLRAIRARQQKPVFSK